MKTKFTCIVPDIQSAIKISGNGATRLQLDISEDEIANVVRLMGAKGKVIIATLEWEDA
jgi:hypothetical protein